MYANLGLSSTSKGSNETDQGTSGQRYSPRLPVSVFTSSHSGLRICKSPHQTSVPLGVVLRSSRLGVRRPEVLVGYPSEIEERLELLLRNVSDFSQEKIMNDREFIQKRVLIMCFTYGFLFALSGFVLEGIEWEVLSKVLIFLALVILSFSIPASRLIERCMKEDGSIDV